MTKARDLANVISGSGTLNANVIPDLPTSKITSGTFADARLSSSSVTQHVDLTALSASNLTSGTVPSARLSLSASDVPDLATSKITSGTFADARLSSSSITQHVDLSNLNASNLTSGTVPNARYGTPTFSAANLTSVPAATATHGSWTIAVTGTNPSSCGSISNVVGKYQKIGQMVYCQCEFYVTSRPLQTGSYRLARWYFTGLPFTSYNFGTTWFAGGHTKQAGMDFSHHHYMTIPSNSTLIQPMLNGNRERLLSAWSTPDSGYAYRQHDGAIWWNQTNKYVYMSFSYMAAS